MSKKPRTPDERLELITAILAVLGVIPLVLALHTLGFVKNLPPVVPHDPPPAISPQTPAQNGAAPASSVLPKRWLTPWAYAEASRLPGDSIVP